MRVKRPTVQPFKEGERVQVVMPDGSGGPTGVVSRAPTNKRHFRTLAQMQHQLGIGVKWDERPFAFSPESSTVSCPSQNLKRLDA